MAAPKIYYTRLSDYTITMSLSENASFPMSNLKTWYEDDQWKSSANTNGQSLSIDFGSAVSRDSLVLANTNIFLMGGAGVVLLQADDNSGFSSPTTVIANLATA